ncbi:hypothetical protein J3E71DRAFT_242975 [Bipolaris maydis]|nr:hypothetical protein J3E71DRAFT_242975 [Bipolaris maydis]
MQLQFLYTLLLHLSSTSAIPTTTTTTTTNPPPCPPSPHPTLPQYQLAYSTYCARHFSPSRSLFPNEKVVFTYRLADARGRPVDWVLSAVWEQGGFLGGGSMEVGVETCLEWFRRAEAEAGCKTGVKGWEGKRGGVRVEARRRKGGL